ncbi:chaperone protein dnaJ [Salpingoeca rosetta]|uniref:Chaperone protein dnaJ n=1 Tax=Salpingoeca rosetta (strain ATCC 50818 / BSB-021) TaxID=946362 RepID=F2U1H0_SALR5|nr:chaperone protein dnaJ [Salpingoeca rosetta]EGD81472.1 chaperone protein dnaJ [Salpingoeca rosetta]|eukprot:XP_004996676.1 chaperone protein dnaJ [Salpingoeca rosetta]
MMDTGQDDSSSPQEVPPEHQQPSTSTDAAASDHNVRDASTQDKSQKEDEEQHEDATTTGSAAAADKDDVDDDDDGEDDEEEGKDEEQHVSVEAFERMNLYDVLQVDKTASVAKIRRAYYKLCLKNHPDRNPEDKKDEAARRFQRISHAYNVLSDAVRRHIYDTQGDGTTASSSSRSSDKLRALHTGDQEFLAMDFAIRFKEFLPLLELIPAMEKRYGFKSGEVQLDVPGMGEEQCPGDATCDIISLPHPTQRLSLALCLSHKRLHQHTAACHTSAHACILLARCLQREWKEDVHRNWVIQQSMPDDPVRPNYPYWFNIRSGVSSWCTTDDGSDTTPPAWATQDHECTKDECGSFGFTRLMDNIWICRRSGTLHLCTPTQCHYREPAPQAVVARISMPASASTTPAAARARPHRTPTSTTPRTHQHQKHKQPQAQDASSAPKQASATEPAMAPATAANTAPTPQTEQQQQQQQKKKKKTDKQEDTANKAAPTTPAPAPAPAATAATTATSRGGAVVCWATRLLFNEDGQDALLDAAGRQYSYDGGTDSELRVIEYEVPATGERVRKVIERPVGSNVGRRVRMEKGVPVIPRTPVSDSASPPRYGDVSPNYGDISPQFGGESPLYRTSMEYIAHLERKAAQVAKREHDELAAIHERRRREMKEQGWESPPAASEAPWEQLETAFAATPAHHPVEAITSPTATAASSGVQAELAEVDALREEDEVDTSNGGGNGGGSGDGGDGGSGGRGGTAQPKGEVKDEEQFAQEEPQQAEGDEEEKAAASTRRAKGRRKQPRQRNTRAVKKEEEEPVELPDIDLHTGVMTRAQRARLAAKRRHDTHGGDGGDSSEPAGKAAKVTSKRASSRNSSNSSNSSKSSPRRRKSDGKRKATASGKTQGKKGAKPKTPARSKPRATPNNKQQQRQGQGQRRRRQGEDGMEHEGQRGQQHESVMEQIKDDMRTAHARMKRGLVDAAIHVGSRVANPQDTAAEPQDFYMNYVQHALDDKDHEPEALGDYVTLRTGEKNFNAIEDDEEERGEEMQLQARDVVLVREVEAYDNQRAIKYTFDPALGEPVSQPAEGSDAGSTSTALRVYDGQMYKVLPKPETYRVADAGKLRRLPPHLAHTPGPPVVNAKAGLKGMPHPLRRPKKKPGTDTQHPAGGSGGGGVAHGDHAGSSADQPPHKRARVATNK